MGWGMSPERDDPAVPGGVTRAGTGIGMQNVRERMRVLYGDLAAVEMVSRPGRGTKVTLLMPVLDSGAENWTLAAAEAARAALGTASSFVEDAVRAMTRG